jgi:hypothetical protein
MLKRAHAIAGATAMALITGFWLSTVAAEAFGSATTIASVKSTILWTLLVLVPALAVAGASGLALANGRRGGLIGAKQRRMPVIAANGLLVLVPSAVSLAEKAQAGAFDTAFYLVQALELVAGAANLALLGLNMRDGLRLGRRPSRERVGA